MAKMNPLFLFLQHRKDIQRTLVKALTQQEDEGKYKYEKKKDI